MTTFNTGNPIGSTAVKDLYDNAENFDVALHTPETTWVDRFGKTRRSWAGSTGYDLLGDYAAGITVTSFNQVIRGPDGEFWRASAGTTLPYVTTGAGLPEDGAFVSVGDAALRQQLADTTDPDNGAGMVGYEYMSSTVQNVGRHMDSLFSRLGVSPAIYGYEPGDDITDLLSMDHALIDLSGNEYSVSAGVERTKGIRNGTLIYGGVGTSTFLGGIVVFGNSEDIQADGLRVIYTGNTASVRGICAHNADRINLRRTYVEGTPDQGIRVQGSDSPDLTEATVIDCMTNAAGSTDLAYSYGAVAIFGGTSITNGAILDKVRVRGVSTAISVMYGTGHRIRDCDLQNTDINAAADLAMGIYVGGLVTDLVVTGNRVSYYPLEGIDVHNTGTSAEQGIRGIFIDENTVTGCGYYGISVVSADSPKIRDCVVSNNVVENRPDSVLGYSGGILIENVESPTAKNNKLYAPSKSATASSFGLRISKCQFPVVEGNYYRGQWDVYENFEDWESLSVSGTGGNLIPANSEGIRLSQVRATASLTIQKCMLVGSASTAKTIRQVGVPITIATLQNNYLNGQIDVAVGINEGLVANNLFRNFSGSLALGSATIAYNNPGWLNFATASGAPVPGAIKGWVPYRRGTDTYYMPLYQPTTM